MNSGIIGLHKWDDRFLEMARNISTWSKDPSTKVGAVVTDNDNRVISVGYNGFPKHEVDDNRLTDREVKYQMIVHAERNAIEYAQMAHWDLKGCNLFTYPFIPCSICAEKINKSGINRVVSLESDNERWNADFQITRTLFQNTEIELLEYPDYFFTWS